MFTIRFELAREQCGVPHAIIRKACAAVRKGGSAGHVTPDMFFEWDGPGQSGAKIVDELKNKQNTHLYLYHFIPKRFPAHAVLSPETQHQKRFPAYTVLSPQTQRPRTHLAAGARRRPTCGLNRHRKGIEPSTINVSYCTRRRPIRGYTNKGMFLFTSFTQSMQFRGLRYTVFNMTRSPHV